MVAASVKTGKSFPLDPEPHDELGNVLVDGHGRAHVFADAQKAESARDSDPDLEMSDRYISHYATSPSCRPDRPEGLGARPRRQRAGVPVQQEIPF